MGLIPEPRSLIAAGTARLFQGLRTGDQRALLMGAAIAAYGWWRKSTGPKRVLVHRSVVRQGRSLVVRNGSDGSKVEIRHLD